VHWDEATYLLVISKSKRCFSSILSLNEKQFMPLALINDTLERIMNEVDYVVIFMKNSYEFT
jgi:hypothetical protein